MAQTSTRADAAALPEGEFAFSWVDFRHIAALVHSEAGIVLSEAKASLVYSRLAKRLRKIGLHSFRDYCALVDSEDGAAERQALIAAMTTNVTSFFREQHHFDHLASAVLPDLVARARRGERVRIWSAACSSGEEPYSIALTVLAAMPDAGDHDLLILATDIDPDMLARGQAGTYPAARLGDIPKPLRGRWLETDQPDASGTFRFADATRRLIRFRHLNLLKPWPVRGTFDVIFCRNVMIYFDQETQDALWSRFAEKLNPGGMLYIGHSERIATDRVPLSPAGQTAYRRDGARR